MSMHFISITNAKSMHFISIANAKSMHSGKIKFQNSDVTKNLTPKDAIKKIMKKIQNTKQP